MHYSLVADSQQVEMLVFTREQFTRMEREQPHIAEKIMTHVMEKVRGVSPPLCLCLCLCL